MDRRPKVEPVMSSREIARNNLRQAKAYIPRDPRERRAVEANIEQIEAYLQRRTA